MATRFQARPADRRHFAALARVEQGVGNVYRAAVTDDELALKRRRFGKLIRLAGERSAAAVDLKRDWDHLWAPLCGRASSAALYFLFTRDRRAAGWAREAIEAIDACRRPHFTYSTCLGVMDLDLRTAHVAHALSIVRCCLGEELDARTHRRLDSIMLERILGPGLAAMRARRIPWMRNKANWRIILPGMFALGAMVWQDRCPEHREVIGFGLEGVLAAFSTGDAAGGWNEGPGYWEYGLSHAAIFAWALRTYTRGKVDLYQHPFLRRTGDFRLAMTVRPGELWNWSDSGKRVESSTLLAILARACQNPAYQWLLFREGVNNISQVYHLDPALPHGQRPRTLPRVIHFPGCGVVVARTGLDARDTYLGVKAADIPHLNHHCQMDGGSIAIHAHGRELLAKLDHWPYPREAPKDPKAPRPSRPGLFDEQLKRYMRWDLDSVAAPGHNIAVVEGQFPQPRLGVKPRIRVLSSGERGDVITVDSSAYYRPMARLARRMVVFLRPATFVVVDQIESGRPVRTRLQYHYHDRAAIDGRDICIRNGPATLLVRTLWPAADDDLVVGLDERHTFYETPVERVSRRNRFAYVENLWRKKKLVFVTLLQAGVRGSKAPAVTLRGDPLRDGRCQLTQAGRGGWTVDLDLDQWSAVLSKP